MKKIIICLLVTFSSSLVFASVTVNWSMPNASDAVFLPATNLPDNSLWQLIWSSTNLSTQSLNPVSPFIPQGGEVLLDEARNSGGGFIFNLCGPYDATNYSLPANTFVGGYVYTRVFDFQGNTSSFTVSEIDNMLFQESTFSAQLQDTSTPTGFPTDHFPFTGSGAVIMSQVNVIPEPTTIAILLMGIFGLVGFRKHLSKD